jgi:hypothetical protein
MPKAIITNQKSIGVVTAGLLVKSAVSDHVVITKQFLR